MIKFPWVSRELYERVSDDLRRSEDERKRLLDLLLGQADTTPLQALSGILPDPTSREAEDLLDPVTGELSGAQIRKMAQAAANKRAGR